MATKQTFKIYIAGTEYSSYINYPVSITKKNLDESFNLASLTLKHTTDAAPFKPNRQVELRIYVDGSLNETLFFILLNDVVEKIGVTTYYNHKLSLIEYTYWLDQQILPDMTITRIEGIYEPTLLDAAERVLSIAGLSTTIAASTQIILNAKLSPEWTFTRMTPLEALRMIFSLVRIVPTMTSFTELGHIGLLDTSETTKMIPYVASQEAYDPQTYKTSLYSNVDNFIAGEGEAIIEPANGWMTPRSPDGFEISNDNAILTTSRPIYKVEELKLKTYRFLTTRQNLGTTLYTFVSLSLIPEAWINNFNLTNFLYEEQVYNTLENKEEIGDKGGSLYYTQGKNNIVGLTYRAPTRWSWNPTKQSIRVITEYIARYNLSTIGNYSLAINSNYDLDFRLSMDTAFNMEHGDIGTNKKYFALLKNQVLDVSTGNVTYLNDSFYDFQFRITYTPYITTNIFTFRERYDAASEIQTYQTYNQTANVIANEVLADLHDKVIKRGSGSGLDLTYLHKNWSDLPTIGKKFGDYVITSADYTINQYGIQATYNIDKYYQKLQKYVAVLEKWRQFSIPNEGIVRRQITFNRFAKFATSSSTNSSGIVAAYYDNTPEDQINIVKLNTVNALTTHYTSNFAFNNALIFEATMISNASAGVKSDYIDDDKRKDLPVRYTDENGRLNTSAVISFHNNYSSAFDLTSSYNLPSYASTASTIASFSVSNIDKDAREQLSFSLQLHHIDTTGKIYINSGWAKRNGLIGGVGINTNIRMAYLDFKPFNTTDATGHIMNSASAAHIYNSVNGGHYIVPVRVNSSGSAAQSWAIIDSTTNEILYWCDEIVASAATNTQYVINFSNTY